MAKSNNSTKTVTMEVPEPLAEDIRRLSEESGSSPQSVMAGLVWIGKKMFGREVILQAKDEDKTLTIHTFEKLNKITTLEDI